MYGTVKAMVYGALPGTGDAPAVYLGLIVFLLALLLLRRGLGDVGGLLVVLAVAVIIEVLDVLYLHQPARAAGPDILHFTLAPCGLWLAVRARLLRV